MKPTTLPDNNENLRFSDLPGPATMDQVPVKRCRICEGVGTMAGVECPHCAGRGATIPHSTEIGIEFTKQIEQAMMAAMLQRRLKDAIAHGGVDALLVNIDQVELDPAHLPCYTAGLVLAVRLLLARFLEEPGHGPAIRLLQRELAGIWDHHSEASYHADK
jgi:hypothetical protein